MIISIVICTYNRCSSLSRTLESLSAMKPLDKGQWEVVVVDNNSTDITRDTIAKFETRLPIRYVFESTQGLSHARNRGVLEAKGDIISFTDDDVVVDEHWLININKAFCELGVACIGGKILPIWEAKPPSWLVSDLYNYLALLDLGDNRLKMQEPNLWGANLSFKSSMFKKYGLFDTSLGRISNKLYSGEETSFLNKLIEKGEEAFYCPEVLVHHCIPVHRMKKRYFKKWCFDSGELEGIKMGNYSARNLFGIPLYIFRKIIQESARYFEQCVYSRDGRMAQMLRLLRLIGIVSGRLKYTKMRGR